MSLIDLRDVRLEYVLDGRSLQVLKRVDLEIKRGEMVAILGPSGSGKSTLLYILGCLLKPSAGSYRFIDQEITDLPTQELADLRALEIGFVFQQFYLLPRADIVQNVMLASRYNPAFQGNEEGLKEKALALIQAVGLSSHLGHRPNQLSGGQQQRVAIARALINDPALILADEPTGNLDSKSAGQVLDLLQEIHRTGRTVVIITHDQFVANRCDRVVTIHDGVLEGRAPASSPQPQLAREEADRARLASHRAPVTLGIGRHVRTAWQNLQRNRARSVLTMLGVTIGIAAVLSTVTLGNYTRRKILASYESLGVNKVVIRAYPRWNLKATEMNGVKFEGVSEKADIEPMKKLFSEIRLISAVEQDWGARSAEYGGHTADQIRLFGVTPEYFPITNSKLSSGHFFTSYHEKNRSRVCVIGAEIAQKLFGHSSALGKIMQINGDGDNSYACKVLGVLEAKEGNSEWMKPDQQILLPASFLALMANQFYAKAHEFDVQIAPGAPIEPLADKVKKFFNRKYGRSVQVAVDSDQILVAQMRRFLNLFSILLSSVALISLAVGGIGIANMMLVSVAERFKEIGLRKALGARDPEIRMQFLVEAVILCSIAGFVGVVCGVIGYHIVLYLASQMFNKITFEWIFDWPAMFLSVFCILAVGIASGIVPAFRAERLEVVEALRSE